MKIKPVQIAVDGFSSCGKSTLARELAKELGYIYIDSGAMYRAVTLYALKNRVFDNDKLDKPLFLTILKEIKIHFELDKNNNPITFLNNQNVENEIRQIEVSSKVSIISAIPEVRERMVKLQREMSKDKSVVMDGRDIGTIVFPDAMIKFFITADLDVRAKRRFDELAEKTSKANFDEVKSNLAERDLLDQTRLISPLKRAENAILIDNSNLDRKEQLDIAMKHVKNILNEG
ncbi:MAG TPA: (d)CMP kinase [Bacteroidales bacterium]|nr:(d)CMP kinase [Bacteroidales bacterium]